MPVIFGTDWRKLMSGTSSLNSSIEGSSLSIPKSSIDLAVFGVSKIRTSGFSDVCSYTHGRRSMPSQLIGIGSPFFDEYAPNFFHEYTARFTIVTGSTSHETLASSRR